MQDETRRTLNAQRVQIAALERRLASLENGVRWIVALALSALLIAGLFTPWGVESPGDEDERAWTVLSVFGAFLEDGGGGGEEIAILVGFVGLTCVVVGMVIALLVLASSRRAGAGAVGRWIVIVLGVLGIIGSLCVLMFTAWATSGTGSSDGGIGGLLLLVGSIVFIPVAVLWTARSAPTNTPPARP